MQSAPINMLVVVVGLIGGSIHVLPPQHISLPPCSTSSPAIICLYRPNCTAAVNKLHVIALPAIRPTATHRAYILKKRSFLVGYPCLATVDILEVTYEFPHIHTQVFSSCNRLQHINGTFKPIYSNIMGLYR